MAAISPLVEARNLSAGYGSMAVVHDVDLAVPAGQVAALVGPNGAGKSTTLLTLAGALRPLGGEVLVEGRSTTAPLHDRAGAGLAFVPEQRSVIMELTATENLRLGRVEPAAALELFPELEPLLPRRAGLLSGGEQQMLSLARALARRPIVLIADELSLGLAPLIVQRLLRAVREAAEQRGVGVLLVEQHVHLALEIADEVYVMRRGHIAYRGSPDALRSDAGALEDAYFTDGDAPEKEESNGDIAHGA
jgi:branched-chain amino acid transport system ATP-binding protein